MSVLKSLRKDKDTRKKIIITLIILFALQIGYSIPLPGINTDYIKAMLESTIGSNSFMSALTGNSFSKMSIFALSITPYISASIFMQLLIVTIPKLEKIQKDGAVGQKKIEKLNIFLGAIIAIIESLIIAIPIGRGGLFVVNSWYMIVYAVTIWTTGAILLMCIGKWMTDHLIGNGISLMLLFNIVASLPSDAMSLYKRFAFNQSLVANIMFFLITALVVYLVFAYVVMLNDSEKKIKIVNSHNAGGIMMGNNDNTLPLKLNIGGVMPIIFTSTIMSFPAVLINIFKIDQESGIGKFLLAFNQMNWFNPDNMIYTLGVIPFILLTFLFARFYMAITFNTKDIAEGMRKSGTIVPGIRPGKPTADYLSKQINSMLWLGTSMLILIAILPTAFSGLTKIGTFSFGGTTILIIVSVILETYSQLEAHTSSVNYKKFIRGRKN